MTLTRSGFAIIQFANALNKRFYETEKRLIPYMNTACFILHLSV